MRGDTVKPFLEWFVIQQLDIMLHDIRASNFMWLQKEDVMIF